MFDLSLEMLRVVENAAVASARTMGMGNPTASDQAAVESMRRCLDTLAIHGTIVLREGERDEAPMLYIGERVGAAGNGGAGTLRVAPGPLVRATPRPTAPADAVTGAGGATEGVLTAAALRCGIGEILGCLVVRDDAQKERMQAMGGADVNRIYAAPDLAPGRNLVFAACGVTGGDLLQGVRFT